MKYVNFILLPVKHLQFKVGLFSWVRVSQADPTRFGNCPQKSRTNKSFMSDINS